MTAKERRRLFFERMQREGGLAPTERKVSAAQIARQAHNSSLIEGCHVELSDLEQTAENLLLRPR